jgi:LemA protein
LSSLQITLVAVAAVLVFWAVGAYNRLMRLRSAILRAFAPVDQQLGLRHTLLQRQIDLLVPVLTEQAENLSALRAACTQAQAARAHASTHPGAAGALNSLRLTEDILLETRARLPAPDDTRAELTALAAQLAVVDTALLFARGRFNKGVMEYNHAVQQFPTRLLAGLFGFRTAGVF